MGDFLSTFVFILPGIMAYFWLQVFGMTPSTKHIAPEIYGVAALFWLPISFLSLLALNCWGYFFGHGWYDVSIVKTVEEFNIATSNFDYLLVFLLVSFLVSFVICFIWSAWGAKLIGVLIDLVRSFNNLAPLSKSSSTWEEYFIRIDDESNKLSEDSKANRLHKLIVKTKKQKRAVYKIYKLDKPETYIAGSMIKVSRPLENDKGIVLADSDIWKDYVDEDYPILRVYVDVKSSLVIEEIDFEKLKESLSNE